MSKTTKLWGGRFQERTNPDVESFTASVAFDRRLYAFDIAGSIAHAQMLHEIGILSEEERSAIVTNLQHILGEIEQDRFDWSDELEDVHMNIEQRLTDLIGDAGKKLHTGRSRNDQVAVDLRLFTRSAINIIIEGVIEFQETLLERAESEHATVMPGYTHLQVAQPITFGHHLMAWFEMLDRDRLRFLDAARRLNQNPLGAAALAGTSIPIDRQMTTDALGFDDMCRNSLDAVSDRDFLMEVCAAIAITMVHLSRFADEMILWSSDAFGFVQFSDEYTTGSSIMPQKKNPDVAELVRGKSARTTGNLQALLVLMKAQPLAYNRDNQEDKETFFDSIDTVTDCLHIMQKLVENMSVDQENMRRALDGSFSTATDLTEFLVKQHVPFREAHEIVGRIVRSCLDSNTTLENLSLEQLNEFSPAFSQAALELIRPENSVASRDHPGGTAPKQVLSAVQKGRQRLEQAWSEL